MRRSSTFLVLALLVAAAPVHAQCVPGVPDPLQSTATWFNGPATACAVSPCPIPVFCPAGDVWATVLVTVLDCTGAPIAGIPACNVLLVSNGCNLFTPTSPCGPAAPYCAGGPTNALGQTRFRVSRAGGCCGGLRVVAQGIAIGPLLPYRSYDVNGDRKVTPLDTAVLAAAIGTCYPAPGYNKCVEFNCAPAPFGCIDVADLALFACHFGHGCQ